MTKLCKSILLTLLAGMTMACMVLACVFKLPTKSAIAAEERGTFSNPLESYHPNRVTSTLQEDNTVDVTLATSKLENGDWGNTVSRAVYSEKVDFKNKALYLELTIKQMGMYGGLRVSLLNGEGEYPQANYGDGISIYFWDETAWGYPALSNLRSDVCSYNSDGTEMGYPAKGYPGLIEPNRIYGSCQQTDPKYYDPENDVYPKLYMYFWDFDANNYAYQVRRTINGEPIVSNTIPKANLSPQFNPEDCYLMLSPEIDMTAGREDSYAQPMIVNVGGVYNGNNTTIKNITVSRETVEEISVANETRKIPLKNFFTFTNLYGQSYTPEFTYQSSDTSVAKINGKNLEIPAMAAGSSTITISYGGVSDSFVLNVETVGTGVTETSLSVGKYLTFNVYALFCEEGTPKMEFTIDGRNKTIMGISSDASKNEYVFSLGGVKPEQMGETITYKLLNGETVLETRTTSIVEYLDAAYKQAGDNDALKTFVVNALAYGSQMQEYKGYKTSELAISKSTISASDIEKYKTDIAPTTDITLKTVVDETLAQSIDVTSYGVKLDKGNTVYVKITMANDMDSTKLKVLFNNKKVDFEDEGNGVYLVQSPTVSMLGFDDKQQFTVKYDNVTVLTFDYSVESYVYAQTAGTDEGDMAKATYSFGKATERYIGKDFDFPAVYVFQERENINTTTQNFSGLGVDYSDELWQTPKYEYCADLDTIWTADDKGSVKGIFYESPVTYGGKKTKIAAYIGYPEEASATNKVPAIVLVHGGLGTAVPQWVKYWNDLGFAAISIDTEGGEPINGISNFNTVHNEKNRYNNGAIDANFTSGPSNGGFSDWEKPLTEQWMYHATSSAILAVSLISSLDCVDTQKIGMTGISWGSVITSIVIGYDDRITFAMPVYGGITLADSGSYMNEMHPSEVSRNRWDSTDALARTNCKVFYITSTSDSHFTPDIASRCAKAAQGFVTYREVFPHGQEHGSELEPNLPVFAKYVCGLPSNYLEVMKHPSKDSPAMYLRRYGNVTINSVKLYCTNEDIYYDNNTNEYTSWTEMDVPFSPDQNAFSISYPSGYKRAFVRIIYNENYEVSTYIWEIDGKNASNMLSAEEVKANASAGDLTCDTYDFDKYMTNVWDSQIVYNESVMFMSDKNGNIYDKDLLFPIAEVLEVRNNTLGILYEEGVDYEVVEGRLRYIPGGKIAVMAYDDYYITSEHQGFIGSIDQQFSSISQSGRYYYYCEDSYLISRQLSVTYIRTKSWEGPEIKRDESKLTKTIEKLENKEALKIVYYGDSVMTGCNSSGMLGTAPYMPKSYELVNEALYRHYGYTEQDRSDNKINGIMTGQGGWTSYNGLNGTDAEKDAFQTRVLNHNPDLVVFHFGANDATWYYSAEQYIGYIDGMIQKVLEQNPNAEFLIVSMSMPNDDAIKGDLQHNMAGIYEENATKYDLPKAYVDAINEYIEGKSNVAFADTTSVTRYALERKDFCDVTANNINHPNDFFIRLEAQLMVDALCKKE